MVLIQILKRKDGSSVIVAVTLALILSQVLPVLTGKLSNLVTGVDDGTTFTYNMPGVGWQSAYLQPVAWALIQILLLEIVVRITIFVISLAKKK